MPLIQNSTNANLLPRHVPLCKARAIIKNTHAKKHQHFYIACYTLCFNLMPVQSGRCQLKIIIYNTNRQLFRLYRAHKIQHYLYS